MLTQLEALTDRLALELADHELAPVVHDLSIVVEQIATSLRAYQLIVTRGAAPLLADVVATSGSDGRLTATPDRPSA